MSRGMVSMDWVKLSAAARRERDPIRFMQLIKQLYDVLNTREDEKNIAGEAKTRAEPQRAA
jgi:hypothetical protein